MGKFQRMSKILISTTKLQAASKTEHAQDGFELMIRGGFLRQSSSGLFTFLPMGLRVLEKLKKLIDEEMATFGCQKIDMPCLLSSEHWKKTGRWNGTELYKLRDRRGAEFLLSPTHEEEITMLADNLVTSYKQLPLRLYQIGKKYRDELRPRHGLLRAKEFIMKDMYSFDESVEKSLETYNRTSVAYESILKRLGVPYMVAEADTGNIGGTRSHEFHVISPVGEDTLLNCSSCSYTSNEEKAPSIMKIPISKSSGKPFIDIPAQFRMISALWKILDSLNVVRHSKALIIGGNGKESTPFIVVIPKDRELNEIKLEKVPGVLRSNIVDILDPESDLSEWNILIDHNCYMEGGSLTLPNMQVLDITAAKEGDSCPGCISGSLVSKKAIEVAHTFNLGEKYSKILNSTFRSFGNTMVPFQMGCYGIGVSRLLSSIAEVSRDNEGLIWPAVISPFKICILLPPKGKYTLDDAISVLVNEIRNTCKNLKGFVGHELEMSDIIVDDRDFSTGYKMKDALLLGFPCIVKVSENGNIYKNRM